QDWGTSRPNRELGVDTRNGNGTGGRAAAGTLGLGSPGLEGIVDADSGGGLAGFEGAAGAFAFEEPEGAAGGGFDDATRGEGVLQVDDAVDGGTLEDFVDDSALVVEGLLATDERHDDVEVVGVEARVALGTALSVDG